MFAERLMGAALKAAAEARENCDFAKLRLAILLARRAAGITVPQFAWDMDQRGIVYLAAQKNDAHRLALNANNTY